MNRTLALIFIIPLSVFALNEWHIQSGAFKLQPNAEELFVSNDTLDKHTIPQPVVNLTAPLNQLSNRAHDYLYKQGRLPKRLNNTTFSKFDLGTLKTLQSGDNFILIVDEYQSYTVEITNIIEASNGNRSVFGKVNDHTNAFHQAVMTLTDNTLQGQFNAGDKSYKFESFGEFGWVSKI
ncbi:hypothetical protein [Pseudoalteromonas sp. 68 DY56-GL68]|uniref:hypothetical protein n=1 Tax=Pseudoalteromonas sp. 68 DY56-GL68 TaxID=2974919 RepID=UPI00352B2F0E